CYVMSLKQGTSKLLVQTMRPTYILGLALLGFSLTPVSQAEVVLLAQTSLSGSITDLSGLSGALENGAPSNLLGGFGSGLGYAGGNTFVAVPDRGPNAVSYNPLVDDTVSYIDRFQTFQMQLTASPSGTR